MNKTTEDPKLRAKLDKARTEIMKSPEYAVVTSLLLSRNDEFNEEMLSNGQPTAGTDGIKHCWHPEYVANTNTEELRKTKLHELGHDWLFHTDGRFKRLIEWGQGKGLDDKSAHQLANLAADHAVNNMLADCGETFDDSWVCDRKYKDWSMEEIASDIMTNNPPKPPPPGTGGQPGKGGGHEKMANATAEQQQQAKEATESAIADGSMMDAIKSSAGLEDDSDEQGSGSMASMLDRARANRQPYVDWRMELQDFCGSSKTDERSSTYSRVCRRPVEGLIRPGKKREGKPHIGVILDTSGSMYCDLPKVMVELEAMSDDGFSFEVVCTDGDVYGPYSFGAHEFDYRDLPLEGGGGSDMEPAFECIKEKCPNADAVVFVTDGYIKWPDEGLLSQLPPCLLIEVDRTRKSKEGSRFAKHLLLKD